MDNKYLSSCTRDVLEMHKLSFRYCSK